MRIFKEEQRFTQTWLIIILAISMLIGIVSITVKYLDESSDYSLQEFVISLIVVMLVTGFIFLFKLDTRIDQDGIHYKFFPFHWSFKVINWVAINKAYVRTYDPIGEYGGWGLKGGAFWNKGKGKAINVSGDIGIQIELKDGKKLLIGTQKQADVKSVLSTYKSILNTEQDESH
jgi:general stress protein CsbA